MGKIYQEKTRKIVAYIAVIYGCGVVLLPFLQIANFFWYTPLCLYSGAALLAIGLIILEKRVLILSIFLLLWTFIGPFFFLMLDTVFLSPGYPK
ncbi:hypothetical protein CFREI_07165 [Corynebacterium freiburgense]|nr:hypothetical protein CFREI_07165 [Corynebacterium freiburgense]